MLRPGRGWLFARDRWKAKGGIGSIDLTDYLGSTYEAAAPKCALKHRKQTETILLPTLRER